MSIKYTDEEKKAYRLGYRRGHEETRGVSLGNRTYAEDHLQEVWEDGYWDAVDGNDSEVPDE